MVNNTTYCTVLPLAVWTGPMNRNSKSKNETMRFDAAWRHRIFGPAKISRMGRGFPLERAYVVVGNQKYYVLPPLSSFVRRSFVNIYHPVISFFKLVVAAVPWLDSSKTFVCRSVVIDSFRRSGENDNREGKFFAWEPKISFLLVFSETARGVKCYR